jgi:hypothetical protein
VIQSPRLHQGEGRAKADREVVRLTKGYGLIAPDRGGSDVFANIKTGQKRLQRPAQTGHAPALARHSRADRRPRNTPMFASCRRKSGIEAGSLSFRFAVLLRMVDHRRSKKTRP